MKTSVFVGTSVDGFIARADGSLDFLEAGGQAPHGYDEFIATIDVLVIGRNTYETVLGFEEWPYGERPVVVLSTQPLEEPPKGAVVERMDGSPRDIVASLQQRGFAHAYIDGGVTIQRFLDAGMIHRMTITRVPVLIGCGIPLFGPMTRDISLHHIATRHYEGGLVQSEYDVA